MFAYVGPGAGLALAGSFLTLLVALLTAGLVLLTWPARRARQWWKSRAARRRAAVRRVVVLGLDGLDPRVVEALIAAGEAPHLERLRRAGSYRLLATTWPPLSPVAWSSFATGVNPGKHAIFDFVRCHPATYRPEISTVRLRQSPFERKLLRQARSFWQTLGERGIFSAVLRVPVSFPPESFYGVQLAAASVPDLRGSQGEYTHIREAAPHPPIREAHGRAMLAKRRGETIHAMLPGPRDLARGDGAELLLPLEISRGERNSFVLRVGDRRVALELGKLSPWTRIEFRLSRFHKITGVCRFLLRRWESPCSLYCSPLNLDPERPAMPVSSPGLFARYLAKKQGPFATLGLAEDTGAFSDGVLSEAQFLEQVDSVQDEREAMFFDMLERVRHGLVACVFDGPDRMQHMFWQETPAEAASKPPATTDGDGDESMSEQVAIDPPPTIRALYRKMDALVGRVQARCDQQTALLVLSDHGFSSFARAVDLNAWLAAEGFLLWKRAPTVERPTTLADIDWSQTRAFAFGLCGIVLNVRGRQSRGIVEPGREYEALTASLAAALTGLADPDRGQTAILEARPRDSIYRGPYVEQAPDLVIGYNRGYRVHWQSALGGGVGAAFTDNDKPWRGDHCQHPAVVPGVLFSSVPLRGANARMIDVAPTVLDLLGVRPPSSLDGESLRCGDVNS